MMKTASIATLIATALQGSNALRVFEELEVYEEAVAPPPTGPTDDATSGNNNPTPWSFSANLFSDDSPSALKLKTQAQTLQPAAEKFLGLTFTTFAPNSYRTQDVKIDRQKATNYLAKIEVTCAEDSYLTHIYIQFWVRRDGSYALTNAWAGGPQTDEDYNNAENLGKSEIPSFVKPAGGDLGQTMESMRTV